MTMNEELLAQLKNTYRVTENDIGEDSLLKAKGMTFRLHTYEAENLGHVCTLSMSGMGGLMKMETFILCPAGIQMPLLNMDRISIGGLRNTQLVEFYRTAPEEDAMSDAEYLWIKNRDADLKDYVSAARWYADLLAPYSYAKTAVGKKNRLSRTCREYMREYIRRTRIAEPCPAEVKTARTSEFAHRLVSEGGAAVDQFRQLFGEETTRRVVLHHMYGLPIED